MIAIAHIEPKAQVSSKYDIMTSNILDTLLYFGYTVPNPIRRRITIARALTYVIAP